MSRRRGPAGRSPAKLREATDLGGGVRKDEKGSLRYGVIDNDRQIPQHRQWGRLLNFIALTRQTEEGIDQHYRPNGYAFGVKKPRRTQITQRPNSSSARGIVPACPARCLIPPP